MQVTREEAFCRCGGGEITVAEGIAAKKGVYYVVV